jgi:hypothetical protein
MQRASDVGVSPDVVVAALEASGCLDLLTAHDASEVVKLEVTWRPRRPTIDEYARLLRREWHARRHTGVPVRRTPHSSGRAKGRRVVRRTSGCSPGRSDDPRESDDDEPPLVRLPARVPAARLVPLIRKKLEGGRTVRDLARLAGVPERRFRSILAGDQANVSWSVADAIVTHALDGPTLWLGPLADLYEMAA